MSDAGKGFRGAIVGGFQRDDVLRYIETSAKSHEDMVNRLTEELSEVRCSLQEATEKNTELTQKNAELLEKLGVMTLAEDEMQSEVNRLREQLTTVNDRAVRAEEAERVLLAEKQAMQDELQKLRALRDEFETSKDHLAEIELCAYRRAKEIEHQSKTEMEKLRVQSAEVINRVKSKIDAANDSCRDILKRSQSEADEMAKRAAQLLNQLENVSGKLQHETQKASDAKTPNTRMTLTEVLSGLRGDHNTEEQ